MDSSQGPEQLLPSPIERLPDEVISHILSLLPHASVFACMSVNRQFEGAARREINHTDRLCLRRLQNCLHMDRVGDPVCTSCPRVRFTLDGIGIADSGDWDVIQSLMKMKRLKVLSLKGLHEDRMAPLIFLNSQTLEELSVPHTLPAPPDVCYPRLVTMTCAGITSRIVRSCPRLETLRIMKPVRNEPLPEENDVLKIQSLRKLIVETNSFATPEFLAENSTNLEELWLNGEFRVEEMQENGQPIQFPKLKILKGEQKSLVLSGDIRMPCMPRLEELAAHLYGSPDILSNLPVDSMRSLTLILSRAADQEQESEWMHALSRVVSRLVNIRKLLIIFKNRFWTDEYSQKMVDMFDGLKHLYSIRFTVSDDESLAPPLLDAMVQRIASRSPGLIELFMSGARFTDAALEDLSRLGRLRYISLHRDCDLSALTTDGLLKLLNGNSRQSLQHIDLDGGMTSVNVRQVLNEYMLMLAEQGEVIDLRDSVFGHRDKLYLTPFMPGFHE